MAAARASRLAWALVALAVGTSPARAADPALRWYTLETEHFRVHFHEGPHQEAAAQRAARALEEAHRRIVADHGHAPDRRTEVLVTDDVDFANGSASVSPRAVIHLYTDVPDDLSSLNDYDDYLWLLVVHEYVHIVHLDDASGIPALTHQLFGKLWLPNAATPRWMTEGLATYHESRHTSGGRVRSSLYDAWLRVLTTERPFRLDELTHNPSRWPRGSLPYLHGGHFLDFIARRVGPQKLRAYFRSYGARLVPWALNQVAQEELGEDFVSLFEAWQQALGERYRAQLDLVRARGETQLSALTSSGGGTGQPRFSPDGQRLFYLELGPDRRPAIRSVRKDGSDDRRELALWSGAHFDLSPDGARVAFSAGDVHREFNFYEDLYEADLATGRIERLTVALRATDPGYDPSGSRLTFVGRRGSGRTYLGVLDLRTRAVIALLEASSDERIFSPVFSPDGARIAFSQQRGGARHLRELELSTRAVRDLVATSEMNLQPHYRGEDVLFTSDRTGIYNVHALSRQSGELRQLTNVSGAVFHPVLSDDGRTLAVTALGSKGTNLALVDPSRPPASEPPAPRRAERPPPPYRDDPTRTWPSAPYQPWSTLLPQHWVPLLFADPRGPVVGLSTSGADLVGRHRYSVQAGLGLVSLEPSASVAYSNRSFYPRIDLAASTGIAQAAGFPVGLYDRHHGATASVTLPFTGRDASTALTLGYEWRALSPRYSVQFAPDAPRPRAPRRGSSGALGLGLTFSSARRFADAISAEEGHTLAIGLRRSAPETLGTFEFAAADARYQGYFALPWLSHHVLALRLAAGAAAGDLGERPVFSLGGIALRDPVLQLLTGGRAGAGFLRGFRPGAFAGNSFALLNAEYRLPLAVVDRGHETVPLFLKRLHAAAFTDVGAVGPGALDLGAPRASLGVELRAELTFGVFAATELRAGLARGLAPDGILDLYVTLGGSY